MQENGFSWTGLDTVYRCREFQFIQEAKLHTASHKEKLLTHV
jgi:hypothetical protein